jgi:hypothetical protein
MTTLAAPDPLDASTVMLRENPGMAGGLDGAAVTDATTQRIQPDAADHRNESISALPTSPVTPFTPITEAPTAILTPSGPAGAAGPASSASSASALPGDGEVDRYQTSVANEQLPTAPLAMQATDPSTMRTQPVNVQLPPTQDLPAPARPAAPGTTRTSGSAGGWRNPWLVILIVLVLLGLFGAGLLLSHAAGKSPTHHHETPTAQATATTAAPPPGYTLVKDTIGGYSFTVPQDWTKGTVTNAAPGTHYTIYTNPEGDATFEVESFPASGQQDGATLDMAILKQMGTLSHQTQPESTPQAGVNWIQETADATATVNGTPQTLHLVVQTTTYNGSVYIIFTSVAADSNQVANGQAISLMSGSFTFLS